MSRLVWLCGCLLMCSITPALAHQIELAVDQELQVDSNALSTNTNPVTDGRYRLAPRISLAQRRGSDFLYLLQYRPTWTGYFQFGQLNGVDHQLLGRGSYQADARTELRFDANFLDFRGFRTNTATLPDGSIEIIPTIRGKTLQFNANAALDYSLSATTTATLALNYNRWDYENSPTADNQGYGVLGQVSRALGAHWNVGGNADLRYRAFDESAFSPASFTTTVNANVFVGYQVSDRLSLRGSGGPAGIFTRQAAPQPRLVSRWSPFFDPILCPTGPCGRVWGPNPTMTSNCGTLNGSPILAECGLTSTSVSGVSGFPFELVTVPVDPIQSAMGSDQERITYFFSFALRYEYPQGFVDLTFSRNEDSGSGVSATTIRTSAAARVFYTLSDYWTLDIRGVYWTRESASRVPFSQVTAVRSAESFGGQQLAEAGVVVSGLSVGNFEQDVGLLFVRLRRQLTRRSSISLHFRYYDQESGSSLSPVRTGFDKFIGGVSYLYEFDAFQL